MNSTLSELCLLLPLSLKILSVSKLDLFTLSSFYSLLFSLPLFMQLRISSASPPSVPLVRTSNNLHDPTSVRKIRGVWAWGRVRSEEQNCELE